MKTYCTFLIFFKYIYLLLQFQFICPKIITFTNGNKFPPNLRKQNITTEICFSKLILFFVERYKNFRIFLRIFPHYICRTVI